MSKIDELCVTVARIEQKLDDIKPRCNSHGEDIATHDNILRGGNGTPGLSEQVRNIQRDNAKQAAIVSTGITLLSVPLWEYIKYKLGWK